MHSDRLIQTYCSGGKTPFNETWRQSTNPTKGTHAVDHSTAMTRASEGTGEERWMGKLQPRGLVGDLDSWRISRQQDEGGNQNQWWKQTHCQRTPTARKTYRTVLFINIRKEIKHETTEKSSKNFKYQLISQWCKLEKQCLQRPQNGLVTTSHAAKMIHS